MCSLTKRSHFGTRQIPQIQSKGRIELNLLELEPYMEDTLEILAQRLIALQSTSNALPVPELIKEARAKVGWVSQNVAEHTLKATTQLSKHFLRLLLRRHFKWWEPILNHNRVAGRGILHGHVLLGDEVYRGKNGCTGLCCLERNPILRRSMEWLQRERLLLH